MLYVGHFAQFLFLFFSARPSPPTQLITYGCFGTQLARRSGCWCASCLIDFDSLFFAAAFSSRPSAHNYAQPAAALGDLRELGEELVRPNKTQSDLQREVMKQALTE